MHGIRAFCRAALRIGVALLVVGACMLAAGCGKDGSIYGSMVWDQYFNYLSIGGFPTNISYGGAYQISPGTYNCVYQLWDGGVNYSPGVGLVWVSTYSVAADKGSFPFVNGQDHHFQLYLSWYYGLVKAGNVNSIETPAQQSVTPTPGTTSWTEDGILITVTNTIVNLASEDLSKLQKNQANR